LVVGSSPTRPTKGAVWRLNSRGLPGIRLAPPFFSRFSRAVRPLIIGEMSVSAPVAHPARTTDSQVNDLFSRVVADLNDGIWKRNLKTGETWVSPRLMLALGFGANEYLPEKDPIGDWVHREDAETMQTLLRQAARVIGQVTFEIRLRTKQGQYRWFRCRARAWPGSDGKAALVLGALFDSHDERSNLEATKQSDLLAVDTVREKNRELEAAVRDAQQRLLALERADIERTQFLLKASHGLRTSLTNMMGMTELAQRAADAASRDRRLDVALQAGRALQQTLDDLVEYAQVDSHGMTRADREFDLGELVASVCRDGTVSNRRRGLRIDLDYVGQHLMARGDERRVGTLLLRMIRFLQQANPRTPVRFIVRVTSAADDQLAVRLELDAAAHPAERSPTDSPFDSTGALLVAQERADSSHDQLHLPIAERVALSLGGSIEVVRNPGAGVGIVAAFMLARALDGDDGVPTSVPGRSSESLWMIGHPDSGAHLLARRVHRLGFDPLVLHSANEVLLHEERSGSPRWAVVVESAHGFPISFGDVRRLLPHTRIIVSALDGAAQPEADAIGALFQRAPFSPRDLAFTFALNRARKPPATAPKVSRIPRIRRVLLVEDNAVSQLVIAEMLEQLGLQVILASTGEDGVDRYKEHAPDVVLMDIGLPGIDGLEAAKRIRAVQLKGHAKRCPIVALTASAVDSSGDVWGQAGLDGFLAKPVNAEAINAAFQRLSRAP
jgi:CheY-like chemotaxis protein/signal transduction histidine kinase